MKKFSMALAAGLAGMVVFTACGAQSGTVYGKEYIPAHDWTSMDPFYTTQCSGTGSNFSCRQVLSGVIPVEHHKDACYALYFESDKGKKGDDCVPQSTYDSTDIGDFYSKE